MKKIAYFAFAAGFSLLVSCGPSAEDKMKEEKRIADSVAAAIAHVQDSIAAAQQAQADSIAAAQKVVEDSLRLKALEDSLANANAKLKKATAPKPAPKKTSEEKKQEQEIKEVKAATRGRGK